MIGCIIQARMGSSRLPRKIKQKIDNKYTVLDYTVNQLKSSNKIEKMVVATTNLEEDDWICENLNSHNIKFYRGSSEDVLDRFFQCAKQFSIDVIIRITADNPLIDPNIVDLVLNEFLNHECDYVTNTLERTYPYGTEVEVFSFTALEKAWKNANKPSEREHVTPFMRDPSNAFTLINMEYRENLSHLRYTVDRIEDLELVREIVKNIDSRPILLQDILNLYKNKSEIFEINKHVKHDGYLSSLKKDEKYLKSKKNNVE